MYLRLPRKTGFVLALLWLLTTTKHHCQSVGVAWAFHNQCHSHYHHVMTARRRIQRSRDGGIMSRRRQEQRQKQVTTLAQLHDEQAPPYRGMASVNLYALWLDLVRNQHVVATTTMIQDDDDDVDDESTCQVRYGVQLATRHGRPPVCREFVQQVMTTANDNDNTTPRNKRIQAIAATLEALHQSNNDNDKTTSTTSSSGFQYVMDQAGFVVQLQLIRTLRPPAAFDASKQHGGGARTTSSTPPPYEYDRDSFVVGPFRLALRPCVARLNLLLPNNNKLHTPWDVYHNVSPADARGHFLLFPTLQKGNDSNNWQETNICRENCRAQQLTAHDCHDLVHLAATIDPQGSLLVCFNSVGAGASQNHIHCHAWPSPPPPLRHEYPTQHGWQSYAVCQTKGLYDFFDLSFGEDCIVEVTFLEYPCCCFLLSASTTNTKDDEAMTNLGQVLNKVIETIGDAPHNVCLLNRPADVHMDEENDNDEIQQDSSSYASTEMDANVAVDVYVFVRSRERSLSVAPSLKLGASEMMGVFHAQNQEEMQTLCPEPQNKDEDGSCRVSGPHDHSHDHENQPATRMQLALEEISYEPRHELWDTVKASLMKELRD